MKEGREGRREEQGSDLMVMKGEEMNRSGEREGWVRKD